jgi:hypothetical protein
VALSAERNTDALLELILTKSRDITCRDAGSLYVIEEEVVRSPWSVVANSWGVAIRSFLL